MSCGSGRVADVVGRWFSGQFVEVPCCSVFPYTSFPAGPLPSRSPGNETHPMLPLPSRLCEDLVWFCVTSILLQDWNIRGVRNRFNTTLVPGIMTICVPRFQTSSRLFPFCLCWLLGWTPRCRNEAAHDPDIIPCNMGVFFSPSLFLHIMLNLMDGNYVLLSLAAACGLYTLYRKYSRISISDIPGPELKTFLLGTSVASPYL